MATAPKLLDLYRPHPRVTYTGELFNHKTGELFTPPRRVKQSFVAECDINTIMKQYSATGQIRHISANAEKGQYLELPDDVDFQMSLNTVHQGEAAFASLPSKTRDRFHNDPMEFLEFMADKTNVDEAIKLGLATKRPEIAKASAPAPKEPQAPIPASPAPKAPEGS